MFAYIYIGIRKCLLCFSEPFFLHNHGSFSPSVCVRPYFTLHAMSSQDQFQYCPACPVVLDFIFDVQYTYTLCHLVVSPPPCKAWASCWGTTRPPSLRLLSPDVVTVSYLRNLQDQILSSHHPPSQETVSLVRCLLLSLQAHKVDLEGVLYCIALYSRALCSKSRSKLSDIN